MKFFHDLNTHMPLVRLGPKFRDLSTAFTDSPQYAVVPYRGTRRARGYGSTSRRGHITIPRGIRTPVRTTGAVDLGFIDTAHNSALNISTPVLTLLNGCAPGTGGSDRIGRKIVIKSIHVKGYIYPDTTATFNTPKLCLVWDKQPSAVAPAFTDIFDQVGGNNLPYSPINLDNSRRFKILWSKIYNVTGGATVTDSSSRWVEVYKKVNLTTVYNAGSAGTIADIESGALYLVMVGSQVSGTGDCTFYGSTRIRFDQLPR